MKKLFVFLFTFCCVGSIFAKNIQIKVTPENATVILKKEVLPPTAPGVYNIPVILADVVFTVQADGYDPEQFVVGLKSANLMQINLKRNRKEVSITSHPNTADIYVDGRLMGQSPVRFQIFKGETKNIIFQADGYERYTKIIHFNDQPDGELQYDIQLVQNRKDVTVMVQVPAAEFYVDGTLIGKGKNSATFQVYKDRAVELLIKAEGYLDYVRKINFNDDIPSDLTKDLAIDQAYAASEPGADIANKRFEVMARKGKAREDAAQRMKYYISELFETLEINDNVSGWYRTAWNMETYDDKIIRTRIELKEIPDNGDGQLKYKMLLQSQVSYKTTGVKDEDFHNWDRVLKKYVKLLSDIRNIVE